MPQVSARELSAFLRAQGFGDVRQTGSHLRMVHTDGRQVTVPMHTGADIGRGLAVRILRDAGFSVDDFVRLR